MSIKLLSRVWDLDVSGNARAVIQVLCDHANDDGICWPSNDVIAYKVGVSKRQVQNILNDLRTQGVVESIESGGHGPRSTNKVRINLTAIPEKKREKDEVQGSSFDDPEKGEKDEIQRTKDEIQRTKDEIAVSPEPSFLEPSFLEPSKDVTPLPPRGEAYTPDFEEFWKAYPKDCGDKKPSFAQWKRMTAQERKDAMAAIPAFRKGRKWRGGFIKDCQRWLRDKSWESPPDPDPEAVDAYDLWIKGAAKEPPRIGGFR